MYVIDRINLVRFIVGRVDNISKEILDNLNQNLLLETVDLVEIYRILVLDKKCFYIKHLSGNLIYFLNTIMGKLIILNDNDIMYYNLKLATKSFTKFIKSF